MLIYKFRLFDGPYEFKNPWGGTEKVFGVEVVLDTVYVEKSDEIHGYREPWSNRPVTEPVWVDAQGGAYMQFSPVDYGGRSRFHDGVNYWYRPREGGKYVDEDGNVLVFKKNIYERFERV